jgi:DNA-binding transcriptional LysR family regulator
MTIKLDLWRGVEVRHLATLAAVAEAGSFRRAAERLGYSQAAVSAQIATLERLLGTRLFDRPRGRGRVSLTAAGRVALEHAEVIVARLTAAQADISAAGALGAVRIGVFQSVGARLLPQLVIRLRLSSGPALEVVEEPSDAQLLELLRRAELDLAFVMLPLPDGPFSAVEILREPFVLLVPTGSPLAKRKQVALADLRGVPLVAGRSCRATAAAEQAARTEVGELEVAFRSDDNETIRALVAAGLGASLVPRLLIDANDQRLVAVEIEDEMPPRRIGLAWHADRGSSAAVSAVIDATRHVTSGLGLGATNPDEQTATSSRR